MLGAVLDARFELRERIGAGGMAVVYRAQELGLFSRDVAIKLLSPECSVRPDIAQRFITEAQVIARIQHRNIVSLYHAGRAETGQLYLVMELLAGHSLAEEFRALRAENKVLPWPRLAPLIVQVCDALHAAHKLKVVHRDVKPGNCFLLREDTGAEFVKVLDFGIAKVHPSPLDSEGVDEHPQTQQGVFLGTPHYAAPEVIEPNRERPIDGRVDVYSVGVMMYQFLTGTLPFGGGSRLSVLERTLRERPPSPRERAPEREIPVEVDALVMKAMALKPEHRYPSMSSLTEAIHGTLGLPGQRPALRSCTKQIVSGVIGERRALVLEAARGADASRELPDLEAWTAKSAEAALPEPRTLERPKVIIHRLPAIQRTQARALSPTPLNSSEATPVGVTLLASAPARSQPAESTEEQSFAAGRAARHLSLAKRGMLVGLVLLAWLLVYEASQLSRWMASGRDRPTASGQAAADMSPGASANRPHAGSARTNAAGEAMSGAELPAAASRPGADADAKRAVRMRRIADQVRALTSDEIVLDCVRGTLPSGVGVRSELVLTLVIDATGSVLEVSPQRPQAGMRALPAAASHCVVDRVRQLRFHEGDDGALAVTGALEFS